MELGFALAMWAISIIAVGVLGWVVGDMRGSMRVSEEERLSQELRDAQFALVAPPKRMQEAVPVSTTLHQEVSPPQPQQTQLVDNFGDLSNVAELRAEALKIRSNDRVWDAPDISERIEEFLAAADQTSNEQLDHYQQSIKELQRANANTGPTVGSKKAERHACTKPLERRWATTANSLKTMTSEKLFD